MVKINFLQCGGNRKNGKKLFLLLIISCISYSVHATVYYSRTTPATFNTASTWSINPSGTPTNAAAIQNADTFIIQSGHNITVGAARTVNRITVNAGGTLTLGANILTVSGDWINNGTITGSTGRMTASTGAFTNNGVINFTGAGGIIKTTGTLTNTASGTISVVGNGIIVLGQGNYVNNNTSPTAVNFGSATISLTGSVSSQEIGGFSTTGSFLTSRSAGNRITVTGDIRCHTLSMTGNGYTLNLGTGNTHLVRGNVALTNGAVGGNLYGGSSILYIYGGGTIALTGTGVNFVPASSTVVFAGAAAQTFGGTGVGTRTFYNLTFDGAGTKTNTNCTVNNIFTLQGATTAIPSTAVTYGADATLRYNSAVTRTVNNNEWPAAFTTAVLGGGIVIDGTGSIIMNGNKVLRPGIPLTIETTGLLSMGNFSLTLNSTFTNNGGQLSGTSTTNGLVLTGTEAQSIGAVNINGPIAVGKHGNIASVTGNITARGLILNTWGTGSIDLGSSTHSFIALTGTRGSWNANASLVTFSGSISATNAISLAGGASTISFTGAASQMIPPFAYYNLGLSGAGMKNINHSNSVSVGNNWNVAAPTTLAGTASITVTGDIYGTGALTMTAGALRIGGDWTHTGAFAPVSGTVLYYGTNQLVRGLTYNHLQIANAGVKTMAATSTVAGILTIHPSSTLTLGGVTLTLTSTGTPFVNNGSLNPGTSSTVLYNTGGAQNIAQATYHNLSFSGAGTKTVPAGATITVNNNWNVNSPATLLTTGGAVVSGDITGNGLITQGTGGTISLSGAWVHSGTLTGTGTANYEGITQTVANKGYHHLEISNPGIKTLATSTTVKGVLTVNPAATINIGSFTLTLSGSGTPLVNNGNFTAGASSTVHYSSTGLTTIAALDYHNLVGTGGNRTLEGSGIIGILGAFTPGGGTYGVTGSTVDFKGSGSQVIPAFTFNKLIASNAGIKQILASAIVACQTIDIEDDAIVQINSDGGGRLNVIP